METPLGSNYQTGGGYPTSEFDLLLQEADEKKLNGQHEAAIMICEKILLMDLNCVEAFEEIGDNYLSLRHFDKARKALDRALSLNPHSANANYLQGFLKSAVGDFTESVRLLERADELQPNHPEILRCLGWSYFHAGHKKKGIILLERSLALAWDDCLILCDLGVCYLNERDFDRAIDLFRKVLQLEPANDKARECLEACVFFQKEFDRLKRKK